MAITTTPGRSRCPTANNERQKYLKVPAVRELLEAIEHKDDRAVYSLAFWCGFRWQGDPAEAPSDVIAMGMTSGWWPA
jgi:hypothetical protein